MADIATLDFETAAVVDLPKTGVARYAQDLNTRVVCMGWAINDEPVQIWYPGDPFPQRLLDHVKKKLPVVTHNAAFERAIWNEVLPRQLARQLGAVLWFPLTAAMTSQDTMIRAAYWGLPMKLEQVAEALELPFGKDAAGQRMMMKVTRPKDFVDGEPIWWDLIDKSKRDRVGAYCAVDVELERLIDKLLPRLPDAIVEEFILDADMNDRGLLIDRPRVAFLTALSITETSRLDDSMNALTEGKVKDTRAVKALKTYVSDNGVDVEGLAKNDITELLDEDLPDHVRDALLLRQEAAKTSVAKLSSMENAACEDARVRGVFQFYGATRTGRYAGRLIQPQNYPRPAFKRDELEEKLLDVQLGKEKGDLSLVSSALRSCIRAPANKKLVVVDFSQIEARVLAWLAGQNDILQVFASGQDVYTYAANRIGSPSRTLGKVATLGLGYGMGPDRFVETAKDYGLTLSTDEAIKIVKAWRSANSLIQSFWYEIDNLVKDAISSEPNKWLDCPRCEIRIGMFTEKRSGQQCLLIELPSGRYLTYRQPRFDYDEGVSYMGLDQYTKKWTRIRSYGAKFVENIVQAVARDLMLATMLNVPPEYPCVGTVHDEGIWEADDTEAAEALCHVEMVIEELNRRLSWAEGLPMKGEGFIADRYGK
jgi:DNA polymerase